MSNFRIIGTKVLQRYSSINCENLIYFILIISKGNYVVLFFIYVFYYEFCLDYYCKQVSVDKLKNVLNYVVFLLLTKHFLQRTHFLEFFRCVIDLS